jgi:REP element-mobilizing transposase RayT
LRSDKYKDIIVESLDYLIVKGRIDIFAFVIMPNHIHLIWRILEMNGKENPASSFLKFTSHTFKKMLINDGSSHLSLFNVDSSNKEYSFWQRDSLAIPLYSRKVAYQKLNYIHANPVAPHWKLVTDPCLYKYSSAGFYEGKKNDFTFLKDLRREF